MKKKKFVSPERYRLIHNLWFAVVSLIIVNLFFSILQSDVHERIMNAETLEEFVSGIYAVVGVFFSLSQTNFYSDSFTFIILVSLVLFGA